MDEQMDEQTQAAKQTDKLHRRNEFFFLIGTLRNNCACV